MSLLLLFNPSPVINQQALSPVVMQAIETIKPVLILVQSATGQFTTSTIEYSSATNTYNSGLYGGMDQPYPTAPVLYSIDSIRPTVDTISKF